MEKGSEEMKVPLKMDKHNDNDDLFPVHQQEQEQEQWKKEVGKVSVTCAWSKVLRAAGGRAGSGSQVHTAQALETRGWM